MISRSFSKAIELGVKDRVLVIAPHGSYRTSAFINAAEKLNIDVVIASQGKHSIVSEYVHGLHIDHKYSDDAFNTIIDASIKKPFTAIIATDDASTELCARVAGHLNLPHNNPESVRLTQRKDLARKTLQDSTVLTPAFIEIDTEISIKQQVEKSKLEDMFPVVVKPVALSASRGVIRANNQAELLLAIERNIKILAKEPQLDESARKRLLIEEYIPGEEIAVEAMLYDGTLEVLAIFDKPEPLEGPYFEETYYTTPSKQSSALQQAIKVEIQKVCRAYGLTEGPIHAECRINDAGIWILEVAARTIGGLCGRLLNYGTGYSIEELVLLHAMDKRVSFDDFHEKDTASGVLMIPIPSAGIYKRIEGLLEAQRVKYIEDINIQVNEGYELVPLPEGNSYFGFIFAQAPTAKEAEVALREAHACLNIVVAPLWKIDGMIESSPV